MADPAATSNSPWWEDLVDIFVAPGQLFDRRAETPKVGGAFAVLIIGVVVLYYATLSAMQPVYDAAFAPSAEAALRSNPQLTPEALERSKGIFLAIGGVAGAASLAIGSLLIGSLVWMVGRLFGAKFEFKHGFMIAVLAFFPRLIEFVSNALQALLMSESAFTSRYSVSLGLARTLDPSTTSPAVIGLLARVDLFTLWVSFLIWLGLKRVGKLPGSAAAGATVIIWLIGAIPALIGAFRSTP